MRLTTLFITLHSCVCIRSSLYHDEQNVFIIMYVKLSYLYHYVCITAPGQVSGVWSDMVGVGRKQSVTTFCIYSKGDHCS